MSPIARFLTPLLCIQALLCSGCWNRSKTYKAPPTSFSGSSTELKHTVVLATLDEAIPEGKSAVWCASFQMAWSKLNERIKEPVQLDKAVETVERLNRAHISTDELPEGDCYAAAGFVDDGIVNEIQSEMQKRFGQQPRIPLTTRDTMILTYAFLKTQVKFDIPFFDNDSPLEYTDSSGNISLVSSFGIRQGDDGSYPRLHEQVELLYAEYDEKDHKAKEYIIDPCKTSSPNQLILAKVSRLPTLSETIGSLQERIQRARDFHSEEQSFESLENGPIIEGGIHLGPYDQLLIPNMKWDVQHEFTAIKGANVLNKGLAGMYLEVVRQDVAFQLDRSGAILETEADVGYLASPSVYVFNGPFLIMIKRRDAQDPFFVMWVDDAELLCKSDQN